MSAMLRRARPLSWVKTVERRAALFPAPTQTARPFGTVKVILTEDVTGTGYKGEQVEIRGGFMRNFLFPRKHAIYATDDNKFLYDSVDRTAEKERAEALKALKRGRQELSGIPILLKRHVLPDGKQTAQAVMAKDVSAYLRKASQVEVEEEEVRLPHGRPIGSLGEHSVLVRARLSEAEIAILEEELGGKEFEQQAWVPVRVLVEKMKAGGKLAPVEEEEEGKGGEEEAVETGGGGGKRGDMSY